MKVGVLAVQGDFAEHIATLRGLGVEAREIRLPDQLDAVQGLIIPGGESTTLSRLMTLYDLREPVATKAARGMALWGTCAGMIMMAKEITEEDPVPLGIMDIGVHRNAYGRQVDSFEQDLSVCCLGETLFHGIFIRAPMINRLGDGVEVLSSLPSGEPVAVQQGNLLATSFHPELTQDLRFHRHFLDMIPIVAE
ncbi:MAG: glutamine amidotransferase subunit PdxT [SAR202 cluster bacterium Io17-Chloro-G7]|nr:MAG: glutamine amidotransferase subunit PdxT [SAR202 cluster bacterium Io17-Chloro-G7]